MNDQTKKRSAILIGTIICGVSAFLYFAREEEQGFSQPETNPNERSAITISNKSKPGKEEAGVSRTEVESAMGRVFTKEEVELKPPDLPWPAWGYAIGVHEVSAEKNGQVKFYGKVVSESGDPLVGVRLKAKIGASETSMVKRLATGAVYSKESIEVITDRDGKFEVAGFGRRLTITDFEKQGYAIVGESEIAGMAPRKSWSYSFIANSQSSFKPDPKNPEIFTMKKVE